MNLYVRFMKEIEQVSPGADDHVSEADISDASDLRVTLTGIGDWPPAKIRRFLYTLAIPILAPGTTCWRKTSTSGGPSAGSVDSVDLRFARQVVVNPESKTVAVNVKQSAPQSVTKSVAKKAPQHVQAARKKR